MISFVVLLLYYRVLPNYQNILAITFSSFQKRIIPPSPCWEYRFGVWSPNEFYSKLRYSFVEKLIPETKILFIFI